MAKQNSQPSARALALEILYQVMEKQAYANLTLEKSLREADFSVSDKRLITELVSGTIRRKLYLDWALNLYLKRDLAKLNPWLKNILRFSVYQMLYMDKIPPHAIINEAGNLTRRYAGAGLTGLANGVLRSVQRSQADLPQRLNAVSDDLTRRSIEYSLPEVLVGWIDQAVLPEDKAAVYEYLNRPPRVALRVNCLKTNREALQAELREAGIETALEEKIPFALRVERAAWPLQQTEAFLRGDFYIQDPAAMLAAPILAPEADELIYDLCCGVGGKTTHLAEYMKGSGKVVAVELYEHKLELLNSNCKRLGITNVIPRQADVTGFTPGNQDLADKIILDAPCSGWGVLNRRADLRWRQSEANLTALRALQYALLRAASDLVQTGGSLLYSTCTFNPEENERQIERFLQEDDRYAWVGFQEELSFFPLRESDKFKASCGSLTIYPGVYATDGMYFAKLRRVK